MMAADGDIYQAYATGNGAFSYLLRLRKGTTSWTIVPLLGANDQTWLDGYIVAISRSRVYVRSSIFSGQYNPHTGAYTEGRFYSSVAAVAR